MRVFYFIAKHISYTFAVAFFLSLFGIISGLSSYIIGASFAVDSYEKISKILNQWLPIIFLMVIFLFYIVSGLLTPVKLPLLLGGFRRINNTFSHNFRGDIALLKKSYSDFSNLIINNTIISLIFSFATGLSIFAVFFWKHYINGELNYVEYQASLKVILLSTVVFMILFGMAAHILSEYLTNNERTGLYNQILNSGEQIKPYAFFSVKITLNFFIFTIIFISLIIYTVFYERINLLNYGQIALILCLLSALIFLIILNSKLILKTLSDIARVSGEVAEGNISGFKILPLSNEFAEIDHTLILMAKEIDKQRKNLEFEIQELENTLTDINERNEIIQEQLDKANVIRRSILPARIDDWNELKFSAGYNSTEAIGGNFYDVFRFTDNKIGLLIADVSCHGVPAALYTAMAKVSFSNAMQLYDSPRKIFHEVNKDITERFKSQDHMTCFMAVIDDEYNVAYSNAGHGKALIFRKESESIELLDANGHFIGALEDAKDGYEEKTTKLYNGDRLILYTAGIPEAMNNESAEKYSNKRLEKAVIKNKDLPLDEFTESILNDVHKYIEGNELTDDISFLAVELVFDEIIDMIKSSRKLINMHKYSEAIELLENGLAKYPDNQKLLYTLGKGYFRVNDYGKSVQVFDRYIENDKNNKYAFYVKGASHYQLMNYQKAADNFTAAIHIDPNMINALLALGMSYKSLSDYDAAIKIFEQIINIDRGNKLALFEINQIGKLKSGSANTSKK